MTLWSHETLFYDEDLSGIPDSTVTKRNPLGTIIFDKPSLLGVEAKQDKFDEGWGQCLAKVLAVQRINDEPDKTIVGIISSGKLWHL